MTNLTATRPLSPSFPDTANIDARAHSSSAGSPTSVLNVAESASSPPVETRVHLHRSVDNVLRSPRNSSSKNKWSSLDPQNSLFSFASPTKTKPSTPRKPLSLSMKPPTPLPPIDGHVPCSPRRIPQSNGRKHLPSRPPPPPASSPFAASPRRTPATARKLSCARPLPPPVSQYSSSPTKDTPPPLIQKARSPPPPPPMTETPSNGTPTARRKTAIKISAGPESPVAAISRASPLPYGSSPVKACRPKVPKFPLSKKPADKKIQKEARKSSAPPARHGPRRTKSNESDPEGGDGAIYSGPYNKRGQRHGEGQLVWENGDIYQGNFVNNVREGQGTLTYAATQKNNDNGEYVGEWHNNRMHGEGTRRYPNGGLYIGEYEYGKKEGEGRFYYTNGDLFWVSIRFLDHSRRRMHYRCSH